MDVRAPMKDLRQRLDAFASRFGEQARRPVEPVPPAPAAEHYWRSVQDLFTRDVTERGLRELVGRESQETLRYFTREVDLASLQRLPWWRRYPLAIWRVYLATAFRLHPARRVLFAVAAPLLLLCWARYVLALAAGGGWAMPAAFEWLLLAATIIFFLLVLELRDKLTLKGDLEIARQIQFGLLPFGIYRREGAVVCASMRPANTVGGDYFDVIELDGSRLAVVVADVAGKGMPAALLMALLQGSVRTLLNAGFRGADLVGKLNDHLHASIPANRLVTLFHAEYDRATGAFLYVNAGHNAPFLMRRDGTVERLPATGLALGVVPGALFQGEETVLEPGERLLVYTDGVTEAFDARDREYGEPRLAAFLDSHRDLDHERLLEAVRADVLAFCAQSPPADDMTLLVLAREP